MKRLASTLLALVVLAGCGADGEPVTPVYNAKTTVGYNSVSGSFNRTELGVCVGPACQ